MHYFKPFLFCVYLQTSFILGAVSFFPVFSTDQAFCLQAKNVTYDLLVSLKCPADASFFVRQASRCASSPYYSSFPEPCHNMFEFLSFCQTTRGLRD